MTVKLDPLHLKMSAAFRDQLLCGINMRIHGVRDPDIGDMEEATDALLTQCPEETCEQCDAIFCLFGSGLHFHHDGCPACAERDFDPNPDNSQRLLLAHVRNLRTAQ